VEFWDEHISPTSAILNLDLGCSIQRNKCRTIL